MQYETFAEFLSSEMERLGWSAQQVSDASSGSVTTRAVYGYMNGDRVPSRAKFLALAQAFVWPEKVKERGWYLTLPEQATA